MTINLFTLAGLWNIARNIVKSQDSQEENKSNWQKAVDDVRHNERMKNNSLHRDVHNIFSNIHNTAEKTLSAVSPAIEPIQKTVDTFTSFFPKKMSGKFFDDEKIFYENLRGDGYTDKKCDIRKTKRDAWWSWISLKHRTKYRKRNAKKWLWKWRNIWRNWGT